MIDDQPVLENAITQAAAVYAVPAKSDLSEVSKPRADRGPVIPGQDFNPMRGSPLAVPHGVEYPLMLRGKPYAVALVIVGFSVAVRNTTIASGLCSAGATRVILSHSQSLGRLARRR